MAQSAPLPTLDLSELLDAIRSILHGCWRFRWLAVAVFWALSVASWTAIYMMPDVFRASARVFVDTQTALRPLLQGIAIETDVMSDVVMMERAIKSRPNLERVARDSDPTLATDEPLRIERAVARLEESVKVERDGANVVKISYQDRDPRKALTVVTTLLEYFITGSLGQKRVDSSSAEEFLVEKLRDYENRLNEAEERLAEFKRKNVGMMPGESSSDYYGRLQAELEKLQQIDGRLRVARNRQSELRRQLEGEEPVFGLVAPDDKSGGISNSPRDRQIVQFEQQLADLQLRYTDTHPDVVALRQTLEALRAERDAASSAGAAARRSYSPLDLNPVYQQMKLQLSQVEVEIAQLQGEHADQSAVVGGLRRKVDVIPAVEAELKRLTRDYDVTRAQYSELLRRVETARLSGDAEKSKSDITFRVIDPPSVPSQPVSPKRRLLLTAALVMSLLAGFGLSLLLSAIRPVYFVPKDLERRFGVPVIGAIRLGQTAAEAAVVRHKANLFMASVAALLLCYGLLLVFAGSPSARLVGQVAGGPIGP